VVASGAVPTGARLPLPTGAREWLHACASMLERGKLVVIDYIEPAREIVARGQGDWLRTYRAHERGSAPFFSPGEQDITADVPLEFLVHVARSAGFDLQRDVAQAAWLVELGIDDLAESARASWDARAHVGDLEAVRHRSRVSEAAALVDRSGL